MQIFINFHLKQTRRQLDQKKKKKKKERLNTSKTDEGSKLSQEQYQKLK